LKIYIYIIVRAALIDFKMIFICLEKAIGMHLSTFTDYSIRTLLYLGLRTDRLVTVSEIAAQYKVSQNHLVKVVHNLSRLGLVKSFKGAKGGIKLAQLPGTIQLGTLIKVLESDGAEMVECLSLDSKCLIDGPCRLKGILKQSMHQFFEGLNDYTLEDILSNKEALEKNFKQNQEIE
jgi:Rrf2 family transcriptional regulator, nitric oxide-sensitive transcriptional repressor